MEEVCIIFAFSRPPASHLGHSSEGPRLGK